MRFSTADRTPSHSAELSNSYHGRNSWPCCNAKCHKDDRFHTISRSFRGKGTNEKSLCTTTSTASFQIGGASWIDGKAGDKWLQHVVLCVEWVHCTHKTHRPACGRSKTAAMCHMTHSKRCASISLSSCISIWPNFEGGVHPIIWLVFTGGCMSSSRKSVWFQETCFPIDTS